MSATIQVDAERGEIRVGGTPFPCVASADAALVVDGHLVRAVTLGERDRLIALTSDDRHRAPHIARLIADAATQSGDDGSTGEVRAAIEAVALHLAGAERPGPLARTTLVLARAAGSFSDTVTDMPALEADRLADMLVASLPADRTDRSPNDDGWTTISFDPIDPGSHHRGPVAARDHLAHLLLRRDRPISSELAALLLGVPPLVVEAAAEDARLGESLAQPGPAIDRWTNSLSPTPFPTSTVDRWAMSNHAAVPAPTAASAQGVDGSVTSPAARVGTAPVGTDGTGSDIARPGSNTNVIEARWASAAAPQPGQAGSVARSPVRHAPTTPHTPSVAADVDPGRWTPGRVGGSSDHHLAGRFAVAADPLDGFTGPARLTTRFHRPEMPSRDPELALDLDAVAVALHRAADLRGIA